MTETNKDNLWNTLASRKHHSKVVDFPDYGPDGKAICQVLIKTLEHDELIRIQKDANNECDRTFIEDKEKINKDSPLWLDRLENIAAKHFLFHCCFEPQDSTKRLFPTPVQVGKLSQDEVNILLQHYRTLQNEKGPMIAYLSGEQFEDWIDRLATAAEEGPYFLDRILPEAKNQLLLHMASQLLALKQSQTDKSSPTMQPYESMKNTNPDPQPIQTDPNPQ